MLCVYSAPAFSAAAFLDGDQLLAMQCTVAEQCDIRGKNVSLDQSMYTINAMSSTIAAHLARAMLSRNALSHHETITPSDTLCIDM